MTCEEYRLYLSEKNALGDVAAAVHAESCDQCRSLGLAQEELIHCLLAVRENVPETPQPLEASVMNAYRRQQGSRFRAKSSLVWRLAWTAGAAILLIAVVLWGKHGNRKPVAIPQSAKVAPAAQVPPAVGKPEPAHVAEIAPKVVRTRHGAANSRTTPRAPVTVASAQPDSAASGFSNLMYCDPISCGGAMQVIRIQVPAFPTEELRPLRPAGGVVQADVVVGPDGVARAIRFVK